MLGRIGAFAAAASLVISSTAFAASNANQGALSQGTPAGVKKAESFTGGNQLLWLVGGGLVVGGVILVATGNGHGKTGSTCTLPGCTTTTTTTTATR
ncbi:MAG: hypothetical protein KGJ78_17905 [Alphaproteobacteria bacterium]|nr:hypothetical protein [Alphaproteobacteria bacterium]